MFGRLVTHSRAIGIRHAELRAAGKHGGDLWSQSGTDWPRVSRLNAAATAAPVNGCP
jgi:hypothetical protein